MSGPALDWSPLYRPVIVFCVCLSAAAGLIFVSQYFRDAMQAEYQRHHARFVTNSGQYLSVEHERALIEDNLPQFQRDRRAGIIGPERRLDWVDAIRAASAGLTAMNVRWSFEPQRPFVPEFPLRTGEFIVHVSPMRLDLDLLHGGDLIDFLARLDAATTGLFDVSACSIGMRSGTVDLTTLRSNVTAECELRWYTLTLRSGQEIGE